MILKLIPETGDKLIAQHNYCKDKGLHCFIEEDARCMYCGKDALQFITLKRAGTEHLTSCSQPNCKRSYTE